MNEQNFSYLKDNLKYNGFGESLYPELENQLKKGAAEFTLPYKSEVNKHAIEATLYFRKSDTTDMYFFNKYDIRVQTEKKDETLAQTMYVNKGSSITLKEAYNLLNGRAVHKEFTDKEDQKYKTWVQLDFSVRDKNGNFERKQFHQNYGFDLRVALSHFAIKEMLNGDDRDKLIRSLERGNQQSVTLQQPDKEVKVFIEANPQYKTVTLYSENGQRMNNEQKQELMLNPEQREQRMKEKEQKVSMVQEDQPGKKPVKGNGKGKEAGDGDLLPKKRNSTKKGLGI